MIGQMIHPKEKVKEQQKKIDMKHIYFNEEWNGETKAPKEHNISSITNYTPRGNNSIRYDKGDMLSDLYFFE